GTSYKRFKGTFTAPEATTSVQNLGQIVIKASWDGFNDSKGGASVTVNKRVAVGDGVLVKVTASQAETFPTTKLNNISDPTFYPLPKGTMDYAVGSEVTYKEGSKSYTYYKLKSGLRVYSKDITATAGNLYENVIKGLRVDANKRYTVVTLNTAQPVPYKVMYTGDSIKFTFEYTKTVPSNLTLNKNPLFSSATWSGSTLTLKLARNGVFLGYRAEQTADGLVLTFNNPTSINGARIFIDPGHGVKDQGASGFNPNYPESVINWEIAQKLSDNLKEAGATVKLLTTRGVSIEPTMEQRIATARAFSPHIYMSVHSNSGGRSSVGSEAYYFYPFAKNLSGYACSEMSSALNTTNRGNKFGLFYVTRESQFVSVLCETGFVSSQSDYNKLIDSKYQERVANGLKNSINSFLKSTGGSGATGTQSTGSTTNTGGGLPKDEAGDSANSSGTISTEITLSETELSLKVGESEKLEYDAGGNKKVDISWKTSDSDVATVSTSGKVKATGKGTANITVTDSKSGSKAVCKVTVGSASSSNETPVKGVSLNLQELNIKADATATLIATISPADASDKTVNWSSSAKSVAKVDGNGTVTGLKEGTATITATTADGDYTAKCNVNVTGSSNSGSGDDNGVWVTGVTLDNKSAGLKVGEKLYLSETVSPSKASNKAVTWESSDENIATVSNSGKVVAVGEGEAAIAVITDDGEYKAKCIITVSK
ncbi:MAG: Ig-like domain-containing protein, partial [Oscillospiraceae bacterium]